MVRYLITTKPPSHLDFSYFGRKFGRLLKLKPDLVKTEINKLRPKCFFRKASFDKEQCRGIYGRANAFKLFLTKKWVFLQILLKNIPPIFYQNHNFFHTHVNDVTCQFCIAPKRVQRNTKGQTAHRIQFLFSCQALGIDQISSFELPGPDLFLFYGLKITMNDEKTTQNKVYISSGYAESNVFSKPS